MLHLTELVNYCAHVGFFIICAKVLGAARSWHCDVTFGADLGTVM